MRKKIGYFFILPVIITLLSLTLYPFLYTLNLSFREWNLYRPHIIKYIGFANYVRLNNPMFWSSLRVSLIFTSCTVLFSLIIGFGLATVFSKEEGKVTNMMRAIFILPMAVPSLVMGLGFRFMLTDRLGVINHLLSLVNIAGPKWLTLDMALLSVILTDVWQWTPFMFLILLAGIQGLPREVYEAAKVDGANSWQLLTHVTLPLLRPMIIVAILFRTADSLKTFDHIYIMTSGGPGRATANLNIYAYERSFQMWKMGEAASAVIFIYIMAFFLSQVTLRIARRKK